jgi:hypothetical protein
MDSKYRFGKIDVNCEGYDHPDDPYILRGSCGVCHVCLSLVLPVMVCLHVTSLSAIFSYFKAEHFVMFQLEYTIELTDEGRAKQGSNYHGWNNYQYGNRNR